MKLEVMGCTTGRSGVRRRHASHGTYQQQETCCILRGRFTITPDGGESQHFQRGDLITFPRACNAPGKLPKTSKNTTTFSKRPCAAVRPAGYAVQSVHRADQASGEARYGT